MSDSTIDPVLSLFARFTALRRTGKSPNEAWIAIKKRGRKLSESQKKRLVTVVTNWEKVEGKKVDTSILIARTDLLPPLPSDEPVASEAREGTNPQAQESESLSGAPEADHVETAPVAHSGNPSNKPSLPESGATAPESLANKLNAAMAHNPPRTGALDSLILDDSDQHVVAEVDSNDIDATIPVIPLDESAMLPNPRYFGDNSILMLQMEGSSEAIRINIARGERVTIGRSAEDVTYKPNIDLSDIENIKDLGISRLHVALKRYENTLMVQDLGSVNRTTVNGEPLHPEEIRALKSGDELRLGKLIFKIGFLQIDN